MYLVKMVSCTKKLIQQEKTATFDTNLNIEQLIPKHIEAMMGHDSLTNHLYETYRNSILSLYRR